MLLILQEFENIIRVLYVIISCLTNCLQLVIVYVASELCDVIKYFLTE